MLVKCEKCLKQIIVIWKYKIGMDGCLQLELRCLGREGAKQIRILGYIIVYILQVESLELAGEGDNTVSLAGVVDWKVALLRLG